jgi:metal-dependent hydrolase (beta-lactamase superfamily II)
MPSAKPVSLTIRTYNVGFGDSFLLSFAYPNRRRHVLIDFGSMRNPVNPRPNHMKAVAEQIALDCDGRLDAVVATHRHRDHIGGFATNSSQSGPGDIIAALEPRVVVQPWTEHPDAPADARVAPSRELRQAYMRRLDSLHAVAASIPAQLTALGGIDRKMRSRLEFLGENNIKNESAVRNLLRMAEAGNGSYVHTGSASGFSHLLPGINVHVLGPPTLVQTESIRQQVHDHPDEFWHLQAGLKLAAARTYPRLFPDAPASRIAPSERWFTRRLEQLRGEELLQIVRILDDAMNNTSVILLFVCGSKSFLFPGDAQWENWQYALSKEKYRKLLRNIDVYKVGHHGSLNATPKSLWKLFRQRGPADKMNRLVSVLSTRHGVHGSEERDSEVPRRTLVTELETLSELINTEDFGADLAKEVHIEF